MFAGVVEGIIAIEAAHETKVDCDPDGPRLKALVTTLDYGDGANAVDIMLKGGALDRVYGEGMDPNPF